MGMFASIIIRTALTAAPLFAQPMHWVAGPFVPDDATRIGDDGAPQVVCRARHAAGVYPGRVVDGTCVVPHGGVEVSRPRFEVLTGSGSWENAHAGLDTAFPAGHENGRPLVLCRARHDKGVYPGRVSGGKSAISNLLPMRKGTVCLNLYFPFCTIAAEFFLRQPRVQFDLIYRWRDFTCG